MHSKLPISHLLTAGIDLTEEDPQSCVQTSAAETVFTQPDLRVALLTGGQDRHYAFGLTMALITKGTCLDLIGGDLVDGPEMHTSPRVRFLNVHGDTQGKSIGNKVIAVTASYARLIWYAARAKPKIFHILWNNKFQILDRTLLMLYYKLLRKKVVLTAHNVNAGRRDSKDSLLNRFTLTIQYTLADHIFVHTRRMKDELVERFHIDKNCVTIIPYGINNAVPNTNLTPAEARRRLGIRESERTILFFGAIKQYKGLEYLVAAFQQIAAADGDCRLIIAGERKKGSEEYLRRILETIDQDSSQRQVIQRIAFIPDDETEVYFKAADVAVLPYTEIFQSGILFLAYSFGLPVIATDVGSFREDIVEGRSGFVCKPSDSNDMAATIRKYFESDSYKHLERRRREIRDSALSRHSWDAVGNLTRYVYAGLLGR
jgi:D-inositol-3-phosphate glycosyltransferase